MGQSVRWGFGGRLCFGFGWGRVVVGVVAGVVAAVVSSLLFPPPQPAAASAVAARRIRNLARTSIRRAYSTAIWTFSSPAAASGSVRDGAVQARAVPMPRIVQVIGSSRNAA